MTQLMIPYNELRFGHEADPPINARKTGRLDDIEDYAASILAHGLIQALNVKQQDTTWFVEDGNKRLAAMGLLVERNQMRPDDLVKCDPTPAGQDSEERSMVANVIRADLHPADKFEVFHNLHARGSTTNDIAQRFNMPFGEVEKFLALGDLSPVLLDAWRTPGVFRDDAFGSMKAFTLAPSIAEQERVFHMLHEHGNLYAHQIRQAFGASEANRTAAKWVKMAGLARYEAAGGAVLKDLFGGAHIIADHALAEQLANEYLAEELQLLLKVGWSWAEFADSLPGNWSYNWSKLTPSGKPDKTEAKRIKQLQAIVDKPGGTYEAEQEASEEIERIEQAATARGWTADQMASAGAVISVDRDGQLSTTYGVLRPASAKPTKTAVGKPAEKKAAVISNAIAARLSITATIATRAALLEEPRLGLVTLLASFLTKRYAYDSGQVCPVRVQASGMGQQGASGTESFPDALARLTAMDDADLFRVGAMIAAQALDLQVQTADTQAFSKATSALAAAINPDRMAEHLRASFDAVDYFKSVSKPFAIAAIKSAVNKDQAKKAESMKKGDLVAFCVANVPGTGWLPAELRTENYAGPK
ncbi:ParB/RepB/Spo0J family partition protein [Mesorhizobium huakuii]|uniref:ParB N-terminal domain-containing protein n=1 Tax=Mesorhizobium huakuii TaxID=28104 RepID=A0A7G6T0S3_9HYPH|nr:hypothetical protein [Mesorhizobium huakuii]QND60355.1 hypothetical protein HB778_30275 [Mesorhizobium huakuii]